MKKNKKINVILPMTIIIIGILSIVIPWYKNISNPLIVIIMMFAIFTIKIINYLSNYNKKDKESLYIAISSLLIGLYCLFIGSAKALSEYPLLITIWISLYSVIRLFKVDFLHDRTDKRFIVFMFNSIFFFIVGIVSSFALYFSEDTSSFILGYLAIIYGLISVYEEYIKIYFNEVKK